MWNTYCCLLGICLLEKKIPRKQSVNKRKKKYNDVKFSRKKRWKISWFDTIMFFFQQQPPPSSSHDDRIKSNQNQITLDNVILGKKRNDKISWSIQIEEEVETEEDAYGKKHIHKSKSKKNQWMLNRKKSVERRKKIPKTNEKCTGNFVLFFSKIQIVIIT